MGANVGLFCLAVLSINQFVLMKSCVVFLLCSLSALADQGRDEIFLKKELLLQQLEQKVARSVVDEKSKEGFLAAQKNWRQFRTGQAQFEAGVISEGSGGYSAMYLEVCIELTDRRLQYLEGLLRRRIFSEKLN